MKFMSKELFQIALIENGIQPIEIPLDLKKATKQQLRDLINELYGAVVELLETQILCAIDDTSDTKSVYFPYLNELGFDNDEDD